MICAPDLCASCPSSVSGDNSGLSGSENSVGQQVQHDNTDWLRQRSMNCQPWMYILQRAAGRGSVFSLQWAPRPAYVSASSLSVSSGRAGQDRQTQAHGDGSATAKVEGQPLSSPASCLEGPWVLVLLHPAPLSIFQGAHHLHPNQPAFLLGPWSAKVGPCCRPHPECPCSPLPTGQGRGLIAHLQQVITLTGL